MNGKTYTIILADGSSIKDLRLNGNNFISKAKLTPEIFEGKLTRVIIFDGSVEEVHTNMELVQITKVEKEYWFVLRDISEEELIWAKIRADIDYLSMMTNVEI